MGNITGNYQEDDLSSKVWVFKDEPEALRYMQKL